MEQIKKISFGDIAVELGYTTSEKINECLEIQRKMQEMGITPKKLGEIMVDKGYLTEIQVKHIYQKQGLEGGTTQIAGYKLLNIIGRGAMGTVYKGVQLSMERQVAIKILSPHLAGNEKFITRFFKEARAVAKLNHPNIIQGIDVGESYGIHYFAMEYAEGKDLETIVKKQKQLDEKTATEIILQIARALDHAHKNNLVHRDIKAGNILITNKDSIAKLCDLGLARVMDENSETQQKVRVGTPAYISPEQARGEMDIDIRSDIYSLGVTFYFCVTGDLPFRSNSAVEVIKMHLSEAPIPPKHKNPKISNTITSIILKMMAKKRDDRYQTPAELISDLEKHLRTTYGAVEILEPQVIESAPSSPTTPTVAKIKGKTIDRFRARRLGKLGIRFRRFKK
jgi:serine/threonine-protein kinase